MKTILDDFHASFLHAVIHAGGELRVIVAEGFRADEPEDITIAGHVISGTYAVDTSEKSRLVEVRFDRPIACQLIDESFTAWTDYEVRDDQATLQVLTRSRYLDFIRERHGWFEATRGPGKHYRVWTYDQVVDVVACQPPIVEISKS